VKLETAERGAAFTLPAGLRVLVAEDNVVNAAIMTRVLRRYGVEPAVVQTGKEAVEAYVAAAGARALDLILMDAQMPEMDGLAATAMIRRMQREGERAPYIVALTAHAREGDRDKCLAAGMDDYLAKPLERSQLERILSRWRR
jgi:CheY-like chemotaxis protein